MATATMTVVTCPNCGAKNRVDPNRAQSEQPKCGRCGTPLAVGAESDDGHPMTVTDATFQRDVLDVRGKPVLVDFWAQWCGPCRMLAPALEQIAGEANGRFVVAKLNVDENPRVAQQYDISSIPAMLIFKDGRRVDELIGLAPRQAILAKLSRYQ
jgi:thioredoxin